MLEGALDGRASGSALLAHRDAHRASLLARSVHDAGLDPTVVFTAPRALACVGSRALLLVVVEVGIASAGPEAFLRAVHACTDAPILALEDGEVPIEGLLRAGASGWVSTDAPPVEVAMRGAALVGLRPIPEVSPQLTWGPLELDLGRREGRWRSRSLKLTPLELRILTALALARGAVMSVRDLSRMVWGMAVAEDRERILAHVRRIRRKIEAEPSSPKFLITVRGEGFRLADHPIPGRSVAQEPALGVERPHRTAVIRRSARDLAALAG